MPRNCHGDGANQIDEAGRILIPARLRRQLGIAPGDAVVLKTKGRELHLRSYKKTIKEAQVIIGKYIPDRDRSLVDGRPNVNDAVLDSTRSR